MEIIERQLRTWEPNPVKAERFAEHRVGREDDFAIRDADSGKITVVQKKVSVGEMLDLPLLLRHLRYKGFFHTPTLTGYQRASGIKAKEQWIGWIPPDTLRRRYAMNKSMLYRENPQLASMLEGLTAPLWSALCEVAPDLTKAHETLVEENIHRDWWLANAPFTSGIINHTNVLPYHRDGGNLGDSWSMMLALRNDKEGGTLHIPEYDVTLGIPNCSLTFFNGQKYWHGVTPIHLGDPDAYRFTIVWYVKRSITLCGSREDELKRARRQASQAMRNARAEVLEQDA